MVNIFTLKGRIDVDNENAKKKVKETTTMAEKEGSNLLSKIGGIATTVVGVGAAVAGMGTAIVAGFKSAADGVAKTADEIDKGSIRMGISTKAFQELSYAAGQSGIEMSTLEKAAKKLEGSDLNLDDAINQIMELGTSEERATKAAELFGDNIAYTLSPLIEQSAEDYYGLIQNANDLNLIMGEDAVKAGVKYGDTMDDINKSFGAIKNNVVSAFIPIIQKVLDLIIQNMPKIQSLFNKLSPLLITLLETTIPFIVELAETLLPPIFEIVEALMPFIISLIEEIMPIFNELMQLIMPLLVDLVQLIMPLLTPFLELINQLLMPILEVLKPIFALLQPFIDLMVVIANVLGTVLKPVFGAISTALTSMFSKWKEVFNNIYNIFKTPINKIIDGINILLKGLNKIKLPDWDILGKAAGKGINIPLISKLKVGMEYVPYDEMPALLHKGEAVLSEEEAREYRNGLAKQNNEVNNNYYNTINIEHLEVREEADIQRISEELYYLQKKAEV